MERVAFVAEIGEEAYKDEVECITDYPHGRVDGTADHKYVEDQGYDKHLVCKNDPWRYYAETLKVSGAEQNDVENFGWALPDEWNRVYSADIQNLEKPEPNAFTSNNTTEFIEMDKPEKELLFSCENEGSPLEEALRILDPSSTDNVHLSGSESEVPEVGELPMQHNTSEEHLLIINELKRITDGLGNVEQTLQSVRCSNAKLGEHKFDEKALKEVNALIQELKSNLSELQESLQTVDFQPSGTTALAMKKEFLCSMKTVCADIQHLQTEISYLDFICKRMMEFRSFQANDEVFKHQQMVVNFHTSMSPIVVFGNAMDIFKNSGTVSIVLCKSDDLGHFFEQ